MNTNANYKRWSISSSPLVASGMGACCSVSSLSQLNGGDISNYVLEKGVLSLQVDDVNTEEFNAFCSSLGRLIPLSDVATGDGYVLDLDGSKDFEKVVSGRGNLALHNDGFILGSRVDFLILFGDEINATDKSGATLVCDQITAWKEIPLHLKHTLEQRKLEYKIVERGYFSKTPNDWHVTT